MKRANNHSNKKKNMAVRYVCLTLLFICVVGAFVWAKFYEERHTKTDQIPSVATYYFDVVGNDTTKKLSQQIEIEQINPGETRRVDFYVRNGDGQQFSQVNMNYEIKLIHTDNLPFEYKLYDANGNLLTGVDMPSSSKDNINDGSSRTYKTYSDDSSFVLDINKINEAEGAMDSQHFMLDIVWDRESSDNVDFKYVKDIDLIYINVNAYEEEVHE